MAIDALQFHSLAPPVLRSVRRAGVRFHAPDGILEPRLGQRKVTIANVEFGHSAQIGHNQQRISGTTETRLETGQNLTVSAGLRRECLGIGAIFVRGGIAFQPIEERLRERILRGCFVLQTQLLRGTGPPGTVDGFGNYGRRWRAL